MLKVFLTNFIEYITKFIGYTYNTIRKDELESNYGYDAKYPIS